MREIKAPATFVGYVEINAKQVDADNEQAVLELCHTIIGKGSDTAIRNYLQTHEKRIAMLKMNHFTIEGDVELKATITATEDGSALKKHLELMRKKERELLTDFIEYVKLHNPSIQVSEMETFIDDFFDGPKYKFADPKE